MALETPPRFTHAPDVQPPPWATSIERPPPTDDDDEWVDARQGRLCFIEGARRTSPGGTELVCTRNNKGVLRWQRAD